MSEFQNRVLAMVNKIPEGNVITYGQLSHRMYGHSGGARAIGGALKHWWHHPNYTDDWGLHRIMTNGDHYEKNHCSDEELNKHPNQKLMMRFIHPEDKEIHWGRAAYLRTKEGYYSKNNLNEPKFY